MEAGGKETALLFSPLAARHVVISISRPLVTSLSTSSSVCFCTCPRNWAGFGSALLFLFRVLRPLSLV